MLLKISGHQVRQAFVQWSPLLSSKPVQRRLARTHARHFAREAAVQDCLSYHCLGTRELPYPTEASCCSHI